MSSFYFYRFSVVEYAFLWLFSSIYNVHGLESLFAAELGVTVSDLCDYGCC